jgi:hypothetical protein
LWGGWVWLGFVGGGGGEVGDGWLGSSQCCQVAKIPAKKLERGRRKKKKSWPDEFVAKFWQNFAEKGPKKFFERISFFNRNDKHSETMTKCNYNFVDPST